ncbi:hypothetical protein H101_01316 [Trichophyton interdigitale H6]|nr:hypothetical protein H101_01316 [Trichophyton interdigitale H6]
MDAGAIETYERSEFRRCLGAVNADIMLEAVFVCAFVWNNVGSGGQEFSKGQMQLSYPLRGGSATVATSIVPVGFLDDLELYFTINSAAVSLVLLFHSLDKGRGRNVRCEVGRVTTPYLTPCLWVDFPQLRHGEPTPIQWQS